MIGTAINPTRSSIMHVHPVIEMTKDDKHNMDTHGITCRSKDVYHYKDFKYDRLADAVRYAEIDAAQPRQEVRKS